MITYSSSNLRTGLKIIFQKEPYIVYENELVKPGKGKAFSRVKLKNLLTCKFIEKKFKSTDFLEVADVVDVFLLYLYHDIDTFIFMNDKTFEQILVDKRILGNKSQWLLEQNSYLITLWNNQPITVELNNFVELKVINVNPEIKGDSISRIGKYAELSTGAIVKVPLFVEVNDVIKVDTRSGEYVSRKR
ncbi:elongation factor P [Buchnera aphidicola]|uniref:elongation factor P n=1 Tax=Buchnera aphidicola TaxID=9 RepID=UPI0034648097